MEVNQIKTKHRVTDHGEVYTNLREVNAMLDLVDHETKRIESKFLEPACGNGNFLIEVINRKIQVIKTRYSASQINFERYLFSATASIYGIDIQEDNVIECRERLLTFLADSYKKLFKKTYKVEVINSLRFVLSRNILCGDAETLKSYEADLIGTPILFSDWSIISGSLVKRKDFIFSDLIDRPSSSEMPLFSDHLDEDEAFIPDPVEEFPPVNFMSLGSD
jgi:hypothetical protein